MAGGSQSWPEPWVKTSLLSSQFFNQWDLLFHKGSSEILRAGCPGSPMSVLPMFNVWLPCMGIPWGLFLYVDFRSTSGCLVPSAVFRKIILSGGAIPEPGRPRPFHQAHSLKSSLEAWFKAPFLRTSVSSGKLFKPLNFSIFICKIGIIIVPSSLGYFKH